MKVTCLHPFQRRVFVLHIPRSVNTPTAIYDKRFSEKWCVQGETLPLVTPVCPQSFCLSGKGWLGLAGMGTVRQPTLVWAGSVAAGPDPREEEMALSLCSSPCGFLFSGWAATPLSYFKKGGSRIRQTGLRALAHQSPGSDAWIKSSPFWDSSCVTRTLVPFPEWL